MKKTLILLRHAKAEAGQDDHARPLAERGHGEAQRMGGFMREQGISPAKILCSSSVRTRETLAYAKLTSKAEMLDALYNASEEKLLNVIASQPEDISSLMLIGHNPGLHQLAVELAREGEPSLRRQMVMDFPPATLVVMDLGEISWCGIFTARGKLKIFATPRTV